MSFRPEFASLAQIERRRIAMPPGVRLRLNRLERPEPLPKVLQEAIDDLAPIGRVQQYPAYQPFYERLAEAFALPLDRLVVGAGIEEFIRALFMLSAGKVAFLWPTCAMFEMYGQIFGRPVQRIVTLPDCEPDGEAIASQIEDDCRLVLIANPGQPVDTCLSVDDLRVVAKRCAEIGATLAIDEAYFGFGAPTALELVEEFDRVTVLRTFSKAWGLAGARIGYAVSSPAVHAALNAVRQSGEVSSFSMAAVEALLSRSYAVQDMIDWTIEGRDHLKRRIRDALPRLSVRGAWANHVLIGFGSEAERRRVAERLATAGVLIKADYPAPLDRHALVTCGGVPIMDEFFNALVEAL